MLLQQHAQAARVSQRLQCGVKAAAAFHHAASGFTTVQSVTAAAALLERGAAAAAAAQFHLADKLVAATPHICWSVAWKAALLSSIASASISAVNASSGRSPSACSQRQGCWGAVMHGRL